MNDEESKPSPGEWVGNPPTLREQADSQEWISVKSSNIAAIAYNSGYYVGFSWFERQLFVQFNSGVRWVYREVPEGLWQGFKEAESKGKFFHTNIRNTYPGEKVPD